MPKEPYDNDVGYDPNYVGPPDPTRFAARAEDIEMLGTVGPTKSLLSPEEQEVQAKRSGSLAEFFKGYISDEDDILSSDDPQLEKDLS